MDNIKEIHKYTDDIVEKYKDIRKPVGMDIILDEINNIFSNISKDKLKLLDCGCGCGNYTIELVKLGYNVTSIDQNESMLSILKEKNLKNNDVYNVNIKKELPFNDNTFDIIIINQVMHHFGDFNDNFKDHRHLIKEFSRSIKPKGLLSINTCNKDNYLYGYWWCDLIPIQSENYLKRYCNDVLLKQILEDNCFISKLLICKEPFIGKNYYDKNFIFDENIRKTDTLWEYIDDNDYNQLCNRLKNMGEDNFKLYYEERMKLLEKYGQSLFYICQSTK